MSAQPQVEQPDARRSAWLDRQLYVERPAQGFRPHVDDAAVLDRIAALVVGHCDTDRLT